MDLYRLHVWFFPLPAEPGQTNDKLQVAMLICVWLNLCQHVINLGFREVQPALNNICQLLLLGIPAMQTGATMPENEGPSHHSSWHAPGCWLIACLCWRLGGMYDIHLLKRHVESLVSGPCPFPRPLSTQAHSISCTRPNHWIEI